MALTAAQKKAAADKKAKAAAEAAAAEEVEVDEVEETEETEPTFGVADLVKLIADKLKKTTTTRELRTLLRKMARDGRLDREIVAGNRARWEWAGPEDPEVKAVLKAFKAGELEADKKEKLDALKARKAEKKAAAAAAAETESSDDDELEDDDDE